MNLDKAIQRFAGDVARENELRNLMANAIVAQLIGAGVVKGGTGLKFRYGEDMSRVTLDLDTAWRTGLDEFLRDLKSRLASGWCGFTGEVVVNRPASPRGVPFEYVMQPCDVKLSYLGRPWYTVQLEVGHNEIGDADGCDTFRFTKKEGSEAQGTDIEVSLYDHVKGDEHEKAYLGDAAIWR